MREAERRGLAESEVFPLVYYSYVENVVKSLAFFFLFLSILMGGLFIVSLPMLAYRLLPSSTCIVLLAMKSVRRRLALQCALLAAKI